MKTHFLNIPKDFLKEHKNSLEKQIEIFCKEFEPLEKDKLYVLNDLRTKAFFCECHIPARLLIKKGTIDVPLDPDSQSEYRANRDVVENHNAYLKMAEDAKFKRMFSNIVTEYNKDYEPKKPLKVIGGQHRFLAISSALDDGIDEHHGVKVYFALNIIQRLDVQLISNTNIAVSNDLLDRMLETVKGPELREWSQKSGILESNQDFADRKQRGSQITVRGARTFVVNYFMGKSIGDKEFRTKDTTPYFVKTGGADEKWELISKNKKIWADKGLIKAGEEFGNLIKAQKEYFQKRPDEDFEFSEKPLSYATLSAWAFVAGVLYKNNVRLERHFELSTFTKSDPLNAKVLAKGRHKTDPENYRGLGTRTDVKDRGRLSELFFIQAEKGDGIIKRLVDFAIEKYHAKQAMLKVQRMESKL